VRLLLVRHGHSHHGAAGLIAMPRGCTGLTTTGRAQALALAMRFRAEAGLGARVTLLGSPALRARQTADALLPHLPVGTVTEEPGLCELLPGAADGLTHAAYRATYGAFDPVAEPDRPFAPGGESWRGFLARVGRTLEALAARHAGETVVAATHAGFIVATLLDRLAIPRPGTGAWLDPAHAGITEWRVRDGRWVLVSYNDTAHLGGLHELPPS